VLFVLPLLVAYEAGVVALGAQQPDALRNGADTWIRWALAQLGLVHPLWPALLVGITLLAWALRAREGRPRELPNVWMGMIIESGVFALALWGLSHVLGRLLSVVDLPLALDNPARPGLQHFVSYLGAGIYEEVLFRFILWSLLYRLFQLGELTPLAAGSLAMLVSSLIFAAAHHVGTGGEPFDGAVFLFRALAGAFFALLLQWRGLGITVGAHAGYDVLVGVILPNV
jgi:hypothetical protein